MDRAADVLDYWFGDGGNAGDRMKLWFMGGAAVDQQIRERFGADLERARRGELDGWGDTPRGRLALIILLDQFSRNVYRGTPAAFAQDATAQQLTVEGLDRGMDAELPPAERMFFAMPLTHAEDLALQERAVNKCEAWFATLPAPLQGLGQGALASVRQHRDVIARFGRFPMRNEVLGRSSTPDETAHIEQSRAAGSPV